MRQTPLPSCSRTIAICLAVIAPHITGCEDASSSADPVISKPPRDLYEPMVRTPIDDLRWIDEDLRRNLARCVSDRPLCETGMECFGWIHFSILIQPDGSIRRLRTESACPSREPPEDLEERLLEWRFNPQIENGRPVEVPATLTLGYSLGLSS